MPETITLTLLLKDPRSQTNARPFDQVIACECEERHKNRDGVDVTEWHKKALPNIDAVRDDSEPAEGAKGQDAREDGIRAKKGCCDQNGDR